MPGVFDESKVNRGNAKSKSQFADKTFTPPGFTLTADADEKSEVALEINYRDAAYSVWNTEVVIGLPKHAAEGVEAGPHPRQSGVVTADDGELYKDTGFNADENGVKRCIADRKGDVFVAGNNETEAAERLQRQFDKRGFVDINGRLYQRATEADA